MSDQTRTDQPRTTAEAEAAGWSVDRNTYPWTAYKGPRFAPEVVCSIDTPSWSSARPSAGNTPGSGFSFTHEYDGTLPIESAVHQALGYASLAWSDGTRGVFQEHQAAEAADALLELIREREHQLLDLAYQAWTVIANVSEGAWEHQPEKWREAATRWRDRFHAEIDRHPKPAEEPVADEEAPAGAEDPTARYVAMADDPKLAAAVKMIARTGADGFQLRYSDAETPVVWMAVAEYAVPPERQEQADLEELRGAGGETYYDSAAGMTPYRAVFRLLETMIDGAMCMHCHRPTGITDDHDPMPGGQVICWYQWDPELATFRRACEGDQEQTEPTT